MKIYQATIQEITFTYQDYPISLYESLKRIGLNFPIYVRNSGEGYVCSDGHKRLSAITDILKEEPTFPRFQNIRIIIEEKSRTAAPYSLHNHH